MRLLAFFIVYTLQMAAAVVVGNGQYTVVGPGTLHSARDYDVSVAVHQTNEPCVLKIGITGPSVNETKTVSLDKAGEVTQLKFNLPVLQKGDYNLTAEGVSGLKFNNSTKLNFGEFTSHIKIQTDKGKYKPGDIINYRVLFLDENLKPTEPTKNAIIWFEDKHRNRIKEIKNFKVVSGVYTGKFELSEFSLLGSWSVQVKNDEKYANSQTYFEVEKYVLPKYQVKIEATDNVAVQDGDVHVVVRANYTYGKPVNGKVILVGELENLRWYRGQTDKKEKKSPPSLIRTADMINGKAKFNFNVKEYEEYFESKTSPTYMTITATVEEQFTGVKLNETSGSILYPYRYHMNCIHYENCYNFNAGKVMDMKFEIKYIDGTVLKDTKSVVKLTFTEAISKVFFWKEEEKKIEEPHIEKNSFVFESHMNESGIATFKVNLPDLSDFEGYSHFYDVEMEYAGEKRHLYSTYPHREPKPSDLPEVEEPKEYFKITTQRKQDSYSSKLGEETTFTFNSSTPLKYFIYNIIGRGNILHTERVVLADQPTVYNLTIVPTILMSPFGKLYAYFIDEQGEFHYAETTFHVDFELQNQIKLSVPEQVKPGENVAVQIKTEPNSFVALLAVDQSVLLLGGNNDVDANEFDWRLSMYDTRTPWQGGYSYYPGELTGVVTMTNGNFFYNRTEPTAQPQLFSSVSGLRKTAFAPASQANEVMHSEPNAGGAFRGGAPDVVVRKNFAETWIFDNIERTETETFNWTKKIPDTITTWVLSGFSIHPEKGLGVTKEKVNIKTFLPFFISIRLPYSVKRGEVINVPALVFNYLNKDLDVEVSLENSDNEYEFLEFSNEVINEQKRISNVRVPANEAVGVSFLIRPKILGNIMLKFKAISAVAGDAIHKTLKVVPEGVTEYVNRAYFVNLKNTSEMQETFELELPSDIVPDSEHAEFSVVGDLLGPVLKNLDNLVRKPTGCGEQTMSSMVPNVLVLNYLKKANKISPALEYRIKRNLESGYQNILNYHHEDGSFSSFGPAKDKEKARNGSTWLTAYVLRSLSVISDLIDIDTSILDKGYEFLLSKQAENGSFVENGEYFYRTQKSHLSLTSSVLLSLIGSKKTWDDKFAKGLKYLAENKGETEDLLPKALATYVLQKAKHASAAEQVGAMKTLAKNEEGRMWWSDSESNDGLLRKLWWCWVRNNDVEITSYMLLTLLETEQPEDVLPIMKWLVAQRNSYGGFASTQDTVVGLQALIKFAEKSDYEAAVMNIHLSSKGGKEKREEIDVNDENGLLLQTVELPQGTKTIDFHANGTGTALVQISYQYNLVKKDSKPSFQIKIHLRPDTPPSKLEMEVCVDFVSEKEESSNMAVLEIALPSGYTADETTFEDLSLINRVRLIEKKNADSAIVVYFESLHKNETICLPIEAYKSHAVAMHKPSSIVVYDYYDNEKKATEYYQIKSKLTDLSEETCDCK